VYLRAFSLVLPLLRPVKANLPQFRRWSSQRVIDKVSDRLVTCDYQPFSISVVQLRVYRRAFSWVLPLSSLIHF